MRTLKQSTILIMIFSILTRILSFLFKIYLSRKVGAEILGLFQMCVSVFALFCTISASGIPLILSRKTAEYTAKKRSEELHSVVTGAALLSLGTAFLLVVTAFFLRSRLTFLFSDERCLPLFYIILPALISTVLYQLVRGYLMGKKHYIEYSLTELLEEILKIVACVTLLSNAFLLLSKDVALAIAFTVTDYAVMAVLLILYFVKGGRIAKPSGIKDLVRSGTPITLMRVSAGFISSFIAIALPAALVRSGLTAGEAAAEYGRAVGMAFSLLFAPLSLTGALSVVILPEAAALAAEGKWAELRRRVDHSILFIFLITVFFYALYAVMGECYGELLFGDKKAGTFIAFSAGMVIPVALTGLINTTLNSLGEEKKVFFAFALSAVFLIAEILLLPKYIGIYALSVAESTFYLSQFIFGMVFLLKKEALSGSSFRPALSIMLIAFPTMLSMKIADKICESGSLFLRAALVSTVGAATYALLLFLFRPIPNVKAILFRNKTKPKKIKRRSHSSRAAQENVQRKAWSED